MNEYNWHIEHQCPQCGAPVVLGEADRLFSCPFCRTRLCLLPGDYFRYYIPAPDRTFRDILYIPYWRLKGLSFSVQIADVLHRFVDQNARAVHIGGLPPSLGLRPQVFRLKFVSPDMAGRLLKPDLPAVDAVKDLTGSGPAGFYRTYIGESVGLIYSPVYVENNTLYDAVLKRPACSLDTADMDRLSAAEKPSDWRVAFLSTLCPECGWDLQGEKNALALTCRNCDSVWTCRERAFEKVGFAVLEGGNQVSHYLPFWKMKARLGGIQMESYGDLIRVGNLPKAVTRVFEETPLYFWMPAFKINPALFLRWARQMTVSQPEGKERDTFPDVPLHPVTLSAGEANGSILLTLASIAADKRGIYPGLADIRVTVDECLLVYHPFIAMKNELVHATMNLSIDKRSLSFGANL